MLSPTKSKTQCCFQADGFLVSFYLKYLPLVKEQKSIVIYVVLVTKVDSVQLNINSNPRPIPIEDLCNFIINLEKYLESIEENPQRKLPPFRSINQVFQILMFEELSSENPYFVINFMIRVSSIKPRIMNPYMGTQAAITLENLRSFATSFRQALNELS